MTDPAARLVRPVVVIGLMGAGKTSVGTRLADRLGVPFRDSDQEIVEAAQMSIAEIFERDGEAFFREKERQIIARLLDGTPKVLATGGGAFMHPETRATIRAGAVSVWIRAALDVLVVRTAGRTHRPLLLNGNPREILGRLIEERYPVYRKADVIVDSRLDQSHAAMVGRILEGLAAHARDTGQGALEGVA